MMSRSKRILSLGWQEDGWVNLSNEDQGCKGTDSTQIQIPFQDWLDMEQPVEITVTIEPGDQLNPNDGGKTMQLNDEILQHAIDDAPTLEGKINVIVGMAVGAGSMCWENMSGTGVFQSDQAKLIADQASEAIKTEVTKVLGWLSAPGTEAPAGEKLTD